MSNQAPSDTARPTARRQRAAGIWACVAMSAAAIPFLEGLTGSRVFYIRDLSLYFWGRYLWLRRSLVGGEWPLWDPYVGAGQSAVADALHQMFLVPSLAVRLIGSEVLGFNLWIAAPFPLAALGTWMLLARRFSAPAAMLGAVAYSVCGPIVSTGSFPNMAWSLACLPWVLWAVDRAGLQPRPRDVAVLALVVACQALSGEPVTLFATLALAMGFAATVVAPANTQLSCRTRHAAVVALGLGLGLLIAAVQLAPMVQAAWKAERAATIPEDFWSLHPVALLETVWLHLFGDYYTSQSLAAVPWMPPLNSGREPFFFSLYFGLPLLTLAAFGLLGGASRAWGVFWSAAGVAGLIGAFGAYTPVYPLLRDNLPFLGSFRFPVKYLVVSSMAVAAAAAAGWDAIAARGGIAGGARFKRARFVAAGVALGIGALGYIAAAACIYFPLPTVFKLYALAQWLHAIDPADAAELMLKALPRVATVVVLISVSVSGLLLAATSDRRWARSASHALFAFIVVDLLVRSWGINPAFDPAYLAEPQWMRYIGRDADARFYVGGKRDGTLDPADVDSSRAFRNPPGLLGSASRAALSGQAVFYPSAFRRREMLSYDLAVLWPREFQTATDRFFDAGRDERDRFLDRTGVRFRVLTPRRAEGRRPLVPIPYFLESFLFDWDSRQVAPRVAVVEDVVVVPRADRQIEALFRPGWDSATTAMIASRPAPAGEPGTPVPPQARITTDGANRVVVEAGTDAGGGFVVLLDSFSEDWEAAVDGKPAEIVRANGLFRAVHVAAGRHRVEFVYRPKAFIRGAGASAAGLLAGLVLLVGGRERRQSVPHGRRIEATKDPGDGPTSARAADAGT